MLVPLKGDRCIEKVESVEVQYPKANYTTKFQFFNSVKYLS